MKKHFNYFLFLLLLIFFIPGIAFGQLTGIKTIPGDYATIAAAITDLNTNGAGSGGVTFNIAAGHTEIAPAGGLLLGSTALNASTSASNPVVFQKSGAGANPQITAFTPGTTTTTDGVWKILGTDYVTIDGIDLLENDDNSALGSTEQMEWGYALLKLNNTAPFDGCQNVTIKNCVLQFNTSNINSVGIYSGNHIANSTTALSITDPGDAMNNCKFYNNTIDSAYTGIKINGFAAPSPYLLYDQNNEIGVDGGNFINDFGGLTTATYGIYVTNQNNLKIANNTITNITMIGIIYGINAATGLGSNVDIYNNTVTLNNTSTAGSMYGISNAMGGSGNGNTVNIYSNKVVNSSYLTATSASFYGIYHTAAATNVNIYQNEVNGNIIGGTGGFYGIQGSAGANVNIYNNTISNNQKLGASSTMYLTYASTSIINFYGNNIFNNSVPNSSGTTATSMYGYYNSGSASVENLHDNNIYNNTVGGTNTSTTSYNDGIYTYTIAAAVKNIYNNNIYGLLAPSGNVNGIRTNLGTNHIYNNNIYNLGNNATNTTAGILNGITLTGGVTLYAYNNFISDLQAPASASLDAVRGINITSATASSTIGLYYNTIYLNAVSTGANFGSSGIFHTYSATATTAALDMRNNIIVNNSVPSGTGNTVAFRRSAATSLNNYSDISNNNSFYAGTPGANNLIFFDGTNADQTMSNFKARVSPREALSFSENPPFINSTTPPYDLHISATVPTQTESGGTSVTSPIVITEDFDGNTRNTSTPDVGADEFNGILIDLIPPIIAYTPLSAATGSLSPRTLTAAITDASGVPTSGVGLPVLYWKISVNGTYSAVTGSYVNGDNYQFTFGGGVTVGDTVYYYVVAQDMSTPPNITCNPLVGASGFSANPPAVSTPPTSPNGYFIVGAPLGGDYTVGTAMFNQVTGHNIYFERVVQKVIKEVDVLVSLPEINDEKEKTTGKISTNAAVEKQLMEVEETTWIPMENGMPFKGELYVKKSENPEINFADGVEGVYATITAAVNDLNLRGVSAPTRFLLTDASYSIGETFPITVYVANENVPNSTNTVTFKPNTGVTTTITGATAQNVFGIYDNYVTIDGSNTVGGSTRDLTIVNTYTGGSFNLGVVLWNGSGKVATNTTVKNCIVEGSSTTTSSYGLFLNATGGGYENTSFLNNKIQNFRIGIQFGGADGNKTNNGIISGNIIGDETKPLTNGGILLSQTNNTVITDNDIFGQLEGNGNNSQYGLAIIAGVTNTKIQKNKIHDFYYNGTTGYGCFGIRYNAEATSVTEISNNFIYNIKSDGDGSNLTYSPAGIYIITGGNIQLYYNSIYLSGNTLGAGSYNGRSNCVSIASVATALDFKNNIFQNSMGSFPGSSRTNITYGIYSEAANSAFTDINYNDYYVDGVGPNLGYLGSIRVDLTAWQTATGKDANSISVDPKFESTSNLHIQSAYNAVDGKAQYIAAVLNDIDGDVRSTTTPDIGADEYVFQAPSVLDPTNVSAVAFGESQIDVSFTPNANNNNVVIVFNLNGNFTVPTGTPTVGQPLAGGEVAAITTTSPFAHTGLIAQTTYYYKLFSYNGSDYSPGVAVNAKTPCSIQSLPYSQSFDGTTFPPDCWEIFNNGSGNNWSRSTTNTYAGAGTMYYPYNTSNPADAWAFTPGFNLTSGNSYTIKFWQRVYSASYIEKLKVTVGTDQTVASQTNVLIDLPNLTNVTYQQLNATFNCDSTATYYFAFNCYSASNQWDLFVDEVSIEQVLTLNAPSNLTAVADTFAVLLNWTDNSTNETGFYIERKDGDSLSANPFARIDSVGADVVNYNDQGRTPNTTYTYRVQAYNPDGISDYSNIVTATTIIPVELTSFAANVTDKAISVMWSTATELNNKGFDLERKLDGEWQRLSFVEGKGTTTEKSDYSYLDNFKYEGYEGTVQYRLKQIDFDGTFTYSNIISVEVDFTPKEYALYQNYPNPFNPSTTIKFALPFDSNVRITVYNLLGEQVALLFDQVKEVGYHNITWNASNLASGIYIYRIDAKSLTGENNYSAVKKMLLMK